MGRIKGMFFTVSGFFIVTIVLVLALFVSLTLLQSNERLAEAGGMERVFILDKSLESAILKMDSGINVNITKRFGGFVPLPYVPYTVNITEILGEPFSLYGEDFYNELIELESHVENDQPEISIDPSIVYNSEEKIPIIIEPHDIRYTHVDHGGDVGIEMTPMGHPLYTFDVYLHLYEEIINPETGVEWVIQNPQEGFRIVVRINAVDEEGNRANISQGISLTEVNHFRVEGCDVYFNRIAPSTYEATCDSTTLITTGFSPILLRQMVTAGYPVGLVIFDFDTLGIYKNDTMRIG